MTITCPHVQYIFIFDRVKPFIGCSHQTAFQTQEMGIVVFSVTLFTSYLENRSQVVRIYASTSEICYTNCGAPQGSVLGPLLFPYLVMVLSTFL